MSLASVENGLRWIGGLAAFALLGLLLYGIWVGTQRPAGRTTGRTGAWLRLPWLYFASTVIFLGLSFLGWIPMPVAFPSPVRAGLLALGSLMYFPGMALVLWGRWALGQNYFVSTSLGAQLFADHQLVTRGPYAFVRHPMYLGLMLAALGGLLIYSTWTTLVLAGCAPLIMIRSRREEAALAAEFGEQWRDYCQRVPAWLLFMPRLSRR